MSVLQQTSAATYTGIVLFLTRSPNPTKPLPSAPTYNVSQLEGYFESLEQNQTATNAGPSLGLKWDVGEEEVASVVHKNTGIPVGKLLDFEKESLLRMEQDLSSHVVGQLGPITAISKCIRLSRAGLRYHDRPLGVFLMLGPTGVGKTELAKCLANNLFRDANAMLRIDMSEYMERHAVSRLIGAPPGYVGYEEGGVLTDAVRQRPYQVILFDEYEKADRGVSNLLLQVFDEGRLTDSKGNVADFKNTVIILTSNLGSEALYNDIDEINNEDIDKHRAKAALKIANAAFSPEFVNRLDEICCFQPLNSESIREITKIQLGRVKKLLKDKEIDIEVSDKASVWLSSTGFDSAFGARPLKRLIQASLLNPLASLVIEDKIVAGSKVRVQERAEEKGSSLKEIDVPLDREVNSLRFFLDT